MSEAKPVGSKSQAPCFVLQKEGNQVLQRKEDTLKDLIARAGGVRTAAQDIKNTIKEKLQIKSNLPTGNFLKTGDFTVTEEKRTFARNNFVLELKNHYILLSKLVNYTEYARTNDKIGGNNRANNTLKHKLLDIENQLYQIMCDIKIAILGQGEDAQILAINHEVSSDFRNAAISYYKERIRAYVLMNDFQDIMEFLKTMYTIMN